MIQTRKVQYQCMSKLSPQELASRAHQFLAEGEKKSAGYRKSSNITGMIMHKHLMYIYIISSYMCVDY